MNPMSLYVVQRGRCFICGGPMLPTRATKLPDGQYDNGWNRDHVIPKKRGGVGNRNIALTHVKCNSRKGDKMPSEGMIKRCRTNWKKAKTLANRVCYL